MASIRKEYGGTYYLHWRCLLGCEDHPDGGHQHHRSLKTRDERVASKILSDFNKQEDKKRARLALGLHIEAKAPAFTLSIAFKEYFAAIEPEKSSATLKRVERPACAHFLKIVGDLSLSSITPAIIDSYRVIFLKDHRPATWNSRLATFRSIWNFFMSRDWISQNPWLDVGRVLDAESTHRLRPVDAELMPEIVASCPDRDWQLIVAFLYEAMCRVTEMINLRRTDVLRKDGLIRFATPKERKGDRIIREKFIPLTPALEEIVDEAMRRCDSEYVFSRKERNGRPLLRRKVHKMLQKIGKRVDVTFSPHRIRKTSSTTALETGDGDLRSVQLLLGHADIRTTARYVRPTMTRQRAVMSKLGTSSLLRVPNTRFQEETKRNLQKAHQARRKSARQP